MRTPSRDLAGRQLAELLGTVTAVGWGFVSAPNEGRGTPVYPYGIVSPHPGEIALGRPFGNGDEGADFRFDLTAYGETGKQCESLLDAAVSAVTDGGPGAWMQAWPGDPAPTRRRCVRWTPAGEDESGRFRWTGVEISLVVLL